MASEKTTQVDANIPNLQKSSGWEISNAITKWLFNPLGFTTLIIAWGCTGLFPAAGAIGAGIGVIAGILTLAGMTLWAIQALAALFASLFDTPRETIVLQVASLRPSATG